MRVRKGQDRRQRGGLRQYACAARPDAAAARAGVSVGIRRSRAAQINIRICVRTRYGICRQKREFAFWPASAILASKMRGIFVMPFPQTVRVDSP